MHFLTKWPIAILLLFNTRQILASFDFSAYPACAQPFLYDNAPENCDYGTGDVYDTNKCLCSDVPWLEELALKISGGCGCSTLQYSANTVIALCDRSGTPSTLSVGQMVVAGGCGSGSSASAGPPSSTPTPNSNDAAKRDKFALGIGLGLGIPTIMVGMIGI